MTGPLCMVCEKVPAVGAIVFTFYAEGIAERFAVAHTSVVCCESCMTPRERWDEMVMAAAEMLSNEVQKCILVGVGSPSLPVRRDAELKARQKGWPLVICDRYGIGMVALDSQEYILTATEAAMVEKEMNPGRPQ